MHIHHLDEVDRLLLQEFTADARISYAELGARVGLSESQCLRRIRALEESKIIQGYVTAIDSIALQLPFSVFIEVQSIAATDAQISAFVKAADEWPEIVSCWRIAGDVGYLLQVFTPGPRRYESLLNGLAAIGGFVIVRTHLLLRMVKALPGWQLSSRGSRAQMETALWTTGSKVPGQRSGPSSHSPRPSGSPVVLRREGRLPLRRMDEIDQRILRNLANNCRMSNVQLAARIGLSPAPCLRRVRALEQAGIIRAYYVVIDSDALGLMIFFLFVRLKTQERESHENFVRALSEIPTIRHVYRTSGASDYILHCAASGVHGIEELCEHKVFAQTWIDSTRCALSLRCCSRVDFGKLHDIAQSTDDVVSRTVL